MEKKFSATTNVAISKRRSIVTLIFFIAAMWLTYWMCTDYLLPSFKEILGLSPGKTTFENLELMWVPIASYILINLDICLAISVKRRLKRFNKGGLVFSTVNGLTNGLIVGLIMGIPIGVISFFIYKVDFLSGIYFGLLCGVFFNLVLSLFYEFKKGLLIEFK